MPIDHNAFLNITGKNGGLKLLYALKLLFSFSDAGNEMTTVGPVPSLGPSSTSTVSTATEPIVSDVSV